MPNNIVVVSVSDSDSKPLTSALLAAYYSESLAARADRDYTKHMIRVMDYISLFSLRSIT